MPRRIDPRPPRKTLAEIRREQERLERERRERRERAYRYETRLWSGHVIAGGTYRGLRVPLDVRQAQQRVALAYAAAGAPGYSDQGPLGAIVETLPFDVNDEDHGGDVWEIRADGTLTIGAPPGTDPEFDDDF